jgi:hypothetical protein
MMAKKPTLEDLTAVYDELQESLAKEFAAASKKGPIKLIAVDCNRNVSEGDYGLAIILDRELTEDEKNKFPEEYKGVPIKYDVDKNNDIKPRPY